MIEKAIMLVKQYVNEHIDHTNPHAEPAVFVIWQAVILQNFKCLISTTLPRGMYFELTYDGDRECWYIDVYRKAENLEVADD